MRDQVDERTVCEVHIVRWGLSTPESPKYVLATVESISDITVWPYAPTAYQLISPSRLSLHTFPLHSGMPAVSRMVVVVVVVVSNKILPHCDLDMNA